MSANEDNVTYVADDSLFHGFATEQATRRTALLTTRGALLQSSSYRLGPSDLLSIKVFDAPDLDTKVRIQPTGFAVFPLIGEVYVQNLTLAECEKEVEQRLRAYLKHPDIGLHLEQPKSRTITVMGEVRRPGVYPLRKEQMGIIEAIAEAGGTTEAAGRTVLLIPGSATAIKTSVNAQSNTNDMRAQGVEFSLNELTGDRGKAVTRVPLMGGDILVIRPAGRIEIDGEVRRPGSIPIPPEGTLIGALAAAGGLTYSANTDNVQIIRDIGGGRFAVKAFNIEQLVANDHNDVPLRPGDLIRVNSAPGSFTTRQIVESLNRFFTLQVSGNIPVD